MPENEKQMILFAFEGRGIIPIHIDTNLILFEIRFSSGLTLTATITSTQRKTLFTSKVVFALGVIEEGDIEGAFTEYVEATRTLQGIAFGIACASKLLAMVRATADIRS